MTTTTGILIDPEALLEARRELARHGLSLDSARHRLRPPDTGPTTHVTAGVLDRVASRVGEVIEDLHGLADALERLVDDLGDHDRQVSALLHRVAMRSRA